MEVVKESLYQKKVPEGGTWVYSLQEVMGINFKSALGGYLVSDRGESIFKSRRLNFTLACKIFK